MSCALWLDPTFKASNVDSAGKYCVWRRRKLMLIAGLYKVSKFKAPGVIRREFDT